MKRNYLILLAILLLVIAGNYFNKKLIPKPGGQDNGNGGIPCIRIITLAPSITETVFALGLGSRVAGVTRFCAYPPEAREKKGVGGYVDPNYEAIAALEPDLVILLPEHEKVRRFLTELGIKYLVVHNRTVTEIIGTILTIGNACGAAEQAQTLAAQIDARIKAIGKLTKDLPRARVLISVGRNMSSGSLRDVYIAGKNTFFDELITLAGGRNAFENEKIPYPKLNAEGLLHLDPEVIIDLVPDLQDKRLDKALIIKEWESAASLDAVRNNRVHVLSGDHIVVPGPRFIDLLEDLARIIHPEISKCIVTCTAAPLLP